MDKKTLILFLLSAIALSFLLYGNTIKGDFVYDDHFFSKRQELRDASYLSKIWFEPFLPQHKAAGTYRPLSVFSFALNFIFFGESPVSFHIVNILLNGFVIFLVFLLVLKLFNDKYLAIFSSLFFAFLPIHTEAVAFIKAREEILAALFVLLSWLLFIKAVDKSDSRPGYKKIFLSSVLFFFGVLSKELIIIVPILFLLVYWLKQRVSLNRIVKTGLIFLPILIIYILMRYRALGEYTFGKEDSYFIINPVGYTDFLARIWTAFKIAFIYIGKTFVPFNLSATYHFNHLTLVKNPLNSWQAILGIIFLTTLVILIYNKKTRLSPLGIGALAFLVPYIIISKFIFKGGDILAERWIYFSSIGLSIIGGYLLKRIYEFKKVIGIAIIFCIFLIYGYIIVNRNRIWLSEWNLYKSMIRTAPNSIQGHQNLAKFYLENNEIEQARREVGIAFNIYKDHPPLLNLIGIIAYYDGNYALSERAFLRAIELRPSLSISYSNLARLYFDAGEYQKALYTIKTVIFKLPNPSKKDLNLYNSILKKLGKKSK